MARDGTLAVCQAASRRPSWRLETMFAATLGLLLLGLFNRILDGPFLSDDYSHLKQANSFSEARFADLLTRGGGDGFFRPLGYLGLAAGASWAGFDPFRWRLIGLLLHLANCMLLSRLAVRLGWGTAASFLAAMIFAVHGTRPEAVVWTSAVFDLFATFFVLLGLLLFLEYEAKGGMRLAWSMAAMVAGVLSKESAFVFPAFLVLFLDWRSERARSLRRLAPFAAVACGIFAYRCYLLRGIGGYVDPATGEPQALSFGLLASLRVILFRLWGPLYFPINWSVRPHAVLAAITIVGIVGYLVLLWSRIDRRKAFLSFALVAVTALPALPQLLIAADLEKSRLLYMPSVGFVLLISAAVAGLAARRVQIAVGLGLVAFHATALHHNLEIWSDVAGRADQACTVVSRAITAATHAVTISGLPGSIDGVYFFRNGFQECVERKAGRQLAAFHLSDSPPLPESAESSLVFSWDSQSGGIVRVR